MTRESMEYDVVIVGAGPAGLAAACRLRQLNEELSVCVVEKSSEVGAHILSGAVLEPTALNELFPDWKDRDAPLLTAVSGDEIHVLRNARNNIRVPGPFVPKTMHNEGNYIISLGNFCRWLATQAENLGVEIFPGFAAAEVLYHDNGSVKGIATGDMGIDAQGEHKDSYTPGMELHAKYTLFAEGCRGHLGKELIAGFNLDAGKDPQHYGIGIKEIWKVSDEKHQPGLVVHTAGWPLDESGSAGGGFLYHLEDNQVSLGLIVDLSYSNPHVSPFDEFQRYKHHPVIRRHLEGGDRIAYGARAIVKGGLQSQPRMSFPGGLLIGDDAGTLNFAKIKGSHTAMKSGMIAAEVLLVSRKADDDLCRWVYLDIGRFSGLAETEGEAIRYQFLTEREHEPTGPCILAGPSCDSADVLYEKRPVALPLGLRAGDRVIIRNCGAYTSSYSSVGFNGFPPLDVVVI